jgi:hypothetical protein
MPRRSVSSRRSEISGIFFSRTSSAAAGLVGVADAGGPHDDPGRREVRALDVLHQPVEVDLRVVDEGDRRVDHLLEVVRWDVGGHADRDAGAAVDQQVREARRQDDRLLLGAVVVGDEVHRVHVDVAQHLHGEARQARLRVPHGRGRVVVDRAEVALAVDERVAHREVLRQAHERVVDRRVAVRVVEAHHVADDARALDVGTRRPEAVLAHREQHAPVDGLEPVADVRQRAPDDDGHGVVQVRRPHLVFEGARLDVAAADDVSGHQASTPSTRWII